MVKLKFIPALAIALGVCSGVGYAQNPPMNCKPDGIIEVCTLADTTPAQPVIEVVAPPSPAVPHVTYKDGQLTITAENIPLSDVLHEVSKKTGATLEVPAGSAGEPVFANIGPGSVRDVLVKLLNGTKFNYVMLGSPDTSADLRKIVLTSADQPMEVADSSAPVSPGQFVPVPHKAPVAGDPAQSPEEKRAAFMAEVEDARIAQMQRMQERYADMAAKGMLRTPDSQSQNGAATANPPAATAPPAQDAAAADSSNQ